MDYLVKASIGWKFAKDIWAEGQLWKSEKENLYVIGNLMDEDDTSVFQIELNLLRKTLQLFFFIFLKGLLKKDKTIFRKINLLHTRIHISLKEKNAAAFIDMKLSHEHVYFALAVGSYRIFFLEHPRTSSNRCEKHKIVMKAFSRFLCT